MRELARGEYRAYKGKSANVKKMDRIDADARQNGMPHDLSRLVRRGEENHERKHNKTNAAGLGNKLEGMSKVYYEPLTKLGSHRMMNQVKHRAGGDPLVEGKWRVLKRGDGSRVTVNLVCGYCGQDNTTSNHRRLRCDLCDRPFRQRGYTRAVGARLPPGKMHV